MHSLYSFLLVTLLSLSAMAQGQHRVTPLGTLLSAVALNGLEATRTFYVGAKVDCGINNSCAPTSTTDTSTGDPILGYSALRLELNFTHNANGAITVTCTEGSTRATATGTPSSATLASGTYTLAWSGVVTTPTLTGNKIWPVVINLNMAPVVKCVVSHGGVPGATDTITVKGWLIAD